MDVTGFQFGELLYTSLRCEVWSGVRLADDRSVVLKRPRASSATPDALARLRRGFALSVELPAEAVCRGLDWLEVDGRPLVIMEDSGGRSLAELMSGAPLTAARASALASAIAGALAALHEQRVVHCDLKPANVLILPSGEARLIDLESAVRLDDEPGEQGPGTPAYLAPELTGRSPWGIDERADLYALGGILYEMLSGAPPFVGRGGVERRARALLTERPAAIEQAGVPGALASLVMRLLEPDPDRRYPSAAAARRDIERVRAALSSPDALAALVLEDDLAGVEPAGDPLVARDDALVTLADAFDGVRGGRAGLALIAGAPGVGKSALLRESVRRWRAAGALVGCGRHTLLDRRPYSGLSEALGALVQTALTEPEERLAALRRAAAGRLGGAAGALRDLVPDLELLLGPQPPAPPVSPEQAGNRLGWLFSNLLASVADGGRPVVLALDDLQWADASSLALLARALLINRDLPLFVVGACRDDVEPGHLDSLRAAASATELALAPLDPGGVRLLLEATLPGGISDIEGLTQEIYQRTGGSPLFVSRLLKAARDAGVFRREDSRWSWDRAGLSVLGIADNVAALLVGEVARAPEETRRALLHHACAGASATAELIAVSSGRSPEETGRALAYAVERGLLGHSEGVYRFPHDRVQEAALAQRSPEERRPIHRVIGRHLLARRAERGRDEGLFEAVDHLNLARASLVEQERAELAGLNLEAGQRALAQAAGDRAAEYLEIARALSGDAPAGPARFALHLGLIRAAHLRADWVRAEALSLVALEHTDDRWEIAAVYTARVESRSRQNDYFGAVDVGVEGMNRLGLACPDSPAAWGLAVGEEAGRLQAALAGVELEALADAPLMSDRDTRGLVRFLVGTAAAAYLRPEVMALAVMRAVGLVLSEGNAPAGGWAFATYGMLCAMRGDYPQAEAFGQLALQMNERYGAAAERVRTGHLYACFIEPWSHPLRYALERCRRAASDGLELGIFDTAGFALFNIPGLGFMAGTALPSLSRMIRRGVEVAREPLAYDDARAIQGHFLLVIDQLTGETDRAAELRTEGYDLASLREGLAGRFGAFGLVAAAAAAAATMSGQHREALAWTDAAEPIVPTGPGHFLQPFHRFWRSVSRLALWPEIDPETREAWEAAAREDVSSLRQLEASCPSNWRCRRLIIEAELASRCGGGAGGLYEAAIEQAAEHGFVHLEALGLDRAGEHAERSGFGRAALGYRRQARDAYQRWGADAVADSITARCPALASEVASESEQLSSMLQRATGAILGEEALDRLRDRILRTVVEAASAERGCLLIASDGGLVREASYGRDGADEAPLDSVLQYVQRTLSTLTVSDASTSELLGGDPRARSLTGRAVLCVPLLRGGELLGMIYLENRLVTGVFTAERVAMAEILASVAGGSLLKARRYAGLKARSREALSARDQRLSRLELSQQRLLGALFDGVIGLDHGGVVRTMNPAAVEIIGVPAERLLGLSWPRALARMGADDSDPELADRIAGADAPLELSLQRSDGASRCLEWRGRAVVDATGARVGVAITFRDLTATRALEDKLQHAQKMEALGQFAGGIAHDLNNLLTPVQGYIDLLEQALEAQPETAEHLRPLQSSVGRAAELVKELLAFGRRAEIFLRPLDVRAVMDAGRRAIDDAPERQVRTLWRVPDEACWVEGDATQLHRVIQNLYLNAHDAVMESEDPDGGFILVEVSAVSRPEGTPLPGRPGRFIELSVSDTGAGISPESLGRIWDPFYTSKDTGHGLGLSVVFGVIKAHGGWVTCESRPGRGSVFRCYLPLLTQAPEPAPAPAPAEAEEDSARVLIIDDDQGVRRMGRIALERAGYTVGLAADGALGLARYQESAGYDLVLLDLSMPGLSGEETLNRLLAYDPDAKVILWSGYALSEHGGSAESMGASAFLSKPFRLKHLIELVQTTLG